MLSAKVVTLALELGMLSDKVVTLALLGMLSDKVVTLALELGMFVMVKNTNQNDKQVSETYE